MRHLASVVMLWWVCSAAAGCYREEGRGPGDAGPALEEGEQEVGNPVLCTPRRDQLFSTANGAWGVSTGQFILLDVPCGIANVDELKARLNVCSSQDQCGSPLTLSQLASLVQPFLSGKSQAVRVGSIPLELWSSGGRTRALVDRRYNVSLVADALRAAPQQPPTCGPLGCALGEGEAKGEAKGEGEGEATGEGGQDEGALAWPCCPGCGPCLPGQCEPRPVGNPRVYLDSPTGCNCPLVCEALASLPDDGTCTCRERCEELCVP